MDSVLARVVASAENGGHSVMSDPDDDELQKIHDDAEKDGSDGNYDPPHGIIDMAFPTDDKIAENEAYDKGWDNGYKQR